MQRARDAMDTIVRTFHVKIMSTFTAILQCIMCNLFLSKEAVLVELSPLLKSSRLDP